MPADKVRYDRDDQSKKQIELAFRAPALLLKRIRAERCMKPDGLLHFVRMMWPFVEPSRDFVENWHIGAICEHLEAVTAGQIRRLLINVPPGFCKSLLLNVFWPAWEWGPMNLPSLRYLCASYSQDLTIRDNVRFRQVIMADTYREAWGERVEPSPVQFSLTKVANTKTGWKLASSVSGVGTGERGDRVICLPYQSKVSTDRGDLSVGEIVTRRLPVKVAGWDGDRIIWQEIVEYEINEGRELIVVEHSNGGTISATIGHPVWVDGKGYISIETIAVGDRILCRLRSGTSSCAISDLETEESLLFQSLPGDWIFEQNSEKLSALRQGVSIEAGQAGEILQPPMQGRGGEGARSAEPKGLGDMSILQREVSCSTLSAFRWEADSLFTELRGKGSGWRRSDISAHQQESGMQVFGVRDSVQEAPVSNKIDERAILFKTVRGLDRRSGQYPVSGILDEKAQGDGPSARRASLSIMWSQADKIWLGEAARPPHRLQRQQSERDEFDIPVPGLPSEESSCKQALRHLSPGMVYAVVESVKRTGIIPKNTYNLRVSPEHNYFANGVLVHNCDDPNSVKDTESDKVRDSTNQWLTEVVPTRLNDPQKSAILIIQQRTHEEDASGTVITRDMGYDHLMIPMRYDSTRRYTTAIGWTDPRGVDADGDEVDDDGALAWPEMYPEPITEQLEKDLGPYASAGQLQQSPVPRGGAIFDREWWQPWDIDGDGKIRFPQFDYVVASVDTAFTEKQQNDFSAMTVWGVFRQTGESVVVPRHIDDPGEMMRIASKDYPRVMLIYGWQKRLSMHGPPEERPLDVAVEEWNSPFYQGERQKKWGLVEWVVWTAKRYRIDHLLIETQAAGHTLEQELRRQH